MSVTLGIIGTAGRGPDGAALRGGYYRSMCTVAQVVATLVGATRLVSGSAAYADHVAVKLYLDGIAPELSLHFPTEFTGLGFKETGGQYDCGRTSNWYHSLFSAAEGINSLDELGQAVTRGAHTTVGRGFKDRNTVIANESNVLLAFTFGQGPELKPGGTKDTWDKFLMRREGVAIHGLRAYHFDLTTKRLYSL